MIYILLVIFVNTNNSRTREPMEFSTKAACENARTSIEKIGVKDSYAFCFEKGK